MAPERCASGGPIRRLVIPLAALAWSASASGQLIVNSTADPGDGTCTVSNCTLREAITFANSAPLFSHFISFAIPGTGVHTITLASELPAILGSLTIDGYSQSGATANTLADGDNAQLKIEIDGSNLGSAGCGLRVGGILAGDASAVIRGLIVTGFNVNFSEGICLTRGSDSVVEGNFIGTDATGTVAKPNYDGIGSTFATSGDVIGGTTPAARNLISGNRNRGLALDAPNETVQGNLVGTDATGLAALGNASGLVLFSSAAGAQIGGAAAGARNVFSGNAVFGILYAESVASTTIAGNYIGVDATGAGKLGNGFDGISADGQVVIGGIPAGSGNVISGNSFTGVTLIGGSGTVLEGNFIGTDAAGTAPLGNGLQGVSIGPNANLTLLLHNRIAFNGLAGVAVADNPLGSPTLGNQFPDNSIFGNGGPGIDLGNDGVTANDALDADTGANRLQNFPVLTEVTASSVTGRLDSAPGADFQLEFFANTECHSSGFGPGQTHLGFATVTTNASGTATFTVALTVPAGQRVTATATDTNGNTSEFSLCAAAIPVALVVDRSAGAGSDGNGVLDPGETVSVEPAWKNPSALPLDLSGNATSVTGPPGPSYASPDAAAAYGIIAPAVTRSCTTTPDCFQIFVSAPSIRPAAHWDASFTETLNIASPAKVWTLHVGDTFSDVPRSYPFYRPIETIVHRSITVGCTPTEYCPTDKVPRDQMGLFLARAIAGGGANIPNSGTLNGTPYNCVPGGVSLFSDISPAALYCKAVHYIAARKVTGGCGPAHYCPSALVSRGDMAVFVAKGIVAPGGGAAVPLAYGPDPVTGLSYSCDPSSSVLHFSDVAVSDTFCKHVHFLWAKGVVQGCSASSYCPTLPVGRDEMAKFLTNAFKILLYGP